MDLRVKRKFIEKVDFFPSIKIKTKMSDVLYDVIKCYNNKPKIITEKQYTILKTKPNEEEIFWLLGNVDLE